MTPATDETPNRRTEPTRKAHPRVLRQPQTGFRKEREQGERDVRRPGGLPERKEWENHSWREESTSENAQV